MKAYQILTSPQNSPDKQALTNFFTLLSVCHTVMPEFDPETQKIKYQASSPDELALVEGAAVVGFTFVERTTATVKITLPSGGSQVWEVLNEFPFDSTRKRMSLIVKNTETKEYFLMTKGADSIVLPRIKLDQQSDKIIQGHLDRFAVDGLRTLVVGQKKLDHASVDNIIKSLDRIKISNASDKEDQMNQIYDSSESGLDFVGCTAIEDKLQDGVPETISILMEAGIRIWVLTGDKQVKNIIIKIKLANDNIFRKQL